MSVQISPAELAFRRPFTTEVTEILTIRNPNSTPVAFKVKTTAPKQYCVRPNSGRIEPNREVEVSVLLQAMKHDPPEGFKCRDKFLVQSVPITSDKEFVNVAEIWDNAEKGDVEEKRIRVAFLPLDDPDVLPAAVTPARTRPSTGQFDATPEGLPPAYASPREETARGVNGVLSPGAPASENKTSSNAGSSPARYTPSVSEASGGAPLAAAAAPAAPAVPKAVAPAGDKDATIAALTAKLAEAEALISSLRTDGGLRQRKGVAAATGVSEKAGGAGTAAATDATAASPQLGQLVRQGTEGVPVKVAAILCFFSFLLAYIFF